MPGGGEEIETTEITNDKKYRAAGKKMSETIVERTIKAGKKATKAEMDLKYEADLMAQGYSPKEIRKRMGR